MANDIGPGDLVRLRSGGPRMTVNTRTQEGVACSWFIGDEVRQATFAPAALEPISGESVARPARAASSGRMNGR